MAINKETVNEYIKTNKISHTIAHRELKELVKKEIFRKKGGSIKC